MHFSPYTDQWKSSGVCIRGGFREPARRHGADPPVQSEAAVEPGVLWTPLSLQRAALPTDDLDNRKFYSMRWQRILTQPFCCCPQGSFQMFPYQAAAPTDSLWGVQEVSSMEQEQTREPPSWLSLLREGCSRDLICFPGCAPYSPMMEGKSLKSSQIRSYAAEVLGGNGAEVTPQSSVQPQRTGLAER